MKHFKLSTLGYPRIGPNREMKWALEKYWSKKISYSELKNISNDITEKSLIDQLNAGIDYIGVGSHTLYDSVLDWSFRFGFIPNRFISLNERLNLSPEETYFAMARGHDYAPALDMTKWFDTNYHNLTPEINLDDLKKIKPDFFDYLDSIKQAIKLLGKERVSAEIIGPLTFAHKSNLTDVSIPEVIYKLKSSYESLINSLSLLEVAEIQIHEPALVLEQFHTNEFKKIMQDFFSSFSNVNIKFNLVTYFDDLGEGYNWIVNLCGISTISLDFTRGDNLSLLKKYGFPSDKTLGAGLFDSRSVWSDYDIAIEKLSQIIEIITEKNRIRIQPSSSLMFLPYDIDQEASIDSFLKKKLNFAKQKLQEMLLLSESQIIKTKVSQDSADKSNFLNLDSSYFNRSLPIKERLSQQLKEFNGKKLITSTIGSFPQTPFMRKIRFQYKKGLVTQKEYFDAVDQYIAYCIGVQEGIDLDILVHGEPERSDMVEYFAEKMEGFLFTNNGWVQSYGSRYVRPPIIYGDIKRKDNKAMTTREYIEAAKHTLKPVKGMLTGPITIINWSFPRKDISRRDQSFQLAFALRDEIADLEKCGCRIVQVDEPALREGLPLTKSRQKEYLDMAVNAFKLATSIAKPSTQIVTHFCYSEFGEIVDSIKNMDTDQITIENSRSNNAMLTALASAGFENMIAPGVYDVHSPSIPTVSTLKDRLHHFLQSEIPKENLMVVPDCGLKTRNWNEVIPSLRNIITAVKDIRSESL